MIKKLCSFSGCNNFAEDGSCYCSEHKKEKKTVPFKNAVRRNTNLYQSKEWRKLRRQCLKNQPCCVWCGSTVDLTVDHIIPPEGNQDLFLNENNLQTLCKDCHRIKTANEIRERKNK